MEKQYILNLETGKIELHFSKEEYLALPEDIKKELKSNFLFSGQKNAWVSRSKHNHHYAIVTAKKLGFTDGGKIGERLSYAKELERKAEKAEAKIERLEEYAENAEKRGKALQVEREKYRGDYTFWTQPIILGHAGSEAFGKRRNRIVERYIKGFEEYKKSDYFKQRAESAQATADMKQLKNPIYINNRIEECNKTIRALERNIITTEQHIYEGKPYEEYLTDYLNKLEYEIDKLAFLENCMEEINELLKEHGKKLYTKADIKPGYLIRIRHGWAEVIRMNPKTITARYTEHPLEGFDCSPAYVEVREVKIPEGWTENNKVENPFEIGDIVYYTAIGGNKILRAYQVIKTTDKMVTIRRIDVQENKPIKDNFISDKQERRSVKNDRQGNFVVNYDDWYLYKYIEEEQKAV
jgi:hypothetical protein